MSAVIETIVLCDECGEQCSGDDRHSPAHVIRKLRSQFGWIQKGSKDYCQNCAPKHAKSRPVNKAKP